MSDIVDPAADRDEPFIRWSTMVTYDRNTGVMAAGETIRLRGEDSRRLAERRREIHAARGAQATVQRQDWTPGPWVDADGPTVQPSAYVVSRLPEDHEAYEMFVITVEWAGEGDRWAVRRGRRALFTTGEWILDSVPGGVDRDEWMSMCRYPRAEAFRRAIEAVDTLRINRLTVADVIAETTDGRKTR